MPAPHRTGFSLLEVLVATAILMGAAGVLFHLAGIGAGHATGAQKLADAQWSCRTKMDEITAGVVRAERVRDRPLRNRPGWVYSVEIEPINRPNVPAGMALLRVTVAERSAVDNDRFAVQFSLNRWIRDPDLEDGDVFAAEAPADDLADVLLGEGELR